MKKKNVLIFGSNHIKNNVQGDLISNLDYNYVGYVSNNRSRATRYLKGNYEELEKVVKEQLVPVQKQVANTKAEVASNKA